MDASWAGYIVWDAERVGVGLVVVLTTGERVDDPTPVTDDPASEEGEASAVPLADAVLLAEAPRLRLADLDALTEGDLVGLRVALLPVDAVGDADPEPAVRVALMVPEDATEEACTEVMGPCEDQGDIVG